MTFIPATPVIGQPLVFTCQSGQRNYQIFKDNTDNAISNSETYTIPAVALSDAGLWMCTAEGDSWRGVAISMPVIVPSTGEYSEKTRQNKYLLSM